MAVGFSICTVVGNFVSDPELRMTTSGHNVCSFSLAINSRNQNEPTVFIDVTAWDKSAEFVSKYFRKGSAALISGRLGTSSWTDQNGVKRTKLYINAQDVCFYGSKDDGQSAQAQNAPRYNNAYGAAPAQQAPRFEDVPPNEDLPF